MHFHDVLLFKDKVLFTNLLTKQGKHFNLERWLRQVWFASLHRLLLFAMQFFYCH